MHNRVFIGTAALVPALLFATPAASQEVIDYAPVLTAEPTRVRGTTQFVAGYSSEEREAWLANCRARVPTTNGGVDACGAYLDRYEAAYADAASRHVAETPSDGATVAQQPYSDGRTLYVPVRTKSAEARPLDLNEAVAP